MAWWAAVKERVERWRAPKYPLVIVQWGERTGGEAGQLRAKMRDCGHYSVSYAFDPIREHSSCMECYNAMMNGKGR